ncbi:MAG TPA: CBS domain-containing protein [Gemmatimonadales bacterium]|jgi:CBS domain-containing protein
MRVADVMQTELQVARGTDSLADTVSILAESHISGVPVVDEHRRLVGVLSNSDILEALAEHNDAESRAALFDQTTVQDVMTPRPQTITPEATVKDAAQRMLYLEVHRLFVEQEGKLLGVVTTTDLVRAMAGTKV